MLERKKPVLVSSLPSFGLVFPTLLRQLVCQYGGSLLPHYLCWQLPNFFSA